MLKKEVIINAIIIRPSIEEDFPDLMNVDRVVSYEYFKPLYREGYSHLPLGQNPDYFLELELENDRELFASIDNNSSRRVHVAYDKNIKKVIGFIVFSHQQDSVEIELLLVDKEYRGYGIGKKLVQSVYTIFPVSFCSVYSCRFANEDTLRFYQKLGFHNEGIATTNKKNMYGISYSDMYFLLKLIL